MGDLIDLVMAMAQYGHAFPSADQLTASDRAAMLPGEAVPDAALRLMVSAASEPTRTPEQLGMDQRQAAAFGIRPSTPVERAASAVSGFVVGPVHNDALMHLARAVVSERQAGSRGDR